MAIIYIFAFLQTLKILQPPPNPPPPPPCRKGGTVQPGWIKQDCSYFMHKNWGDEESKVFDTKGGEKLWKKTSQFMIKKDYLALRSNYLCMDCYKKAEKMMNDTVDNHHEADETIDASMEVDNDGDDDKTSNDDNDLKSAINKLICLLSCNSNNAKKISDDKWVKLIFYWLQNYKPASLS